MVEDKVNIGSQSLLAGRVCKQCNCGWMSKLETAVKAFLIGLIDGTRDLSTLDEDQKLLLARWATKTAYMVNHTWKVPPIVPIKHIQQLHAVHSNLPQGVMVFANQHCKGSGVEWMQGRDWVCAYSIFIRREAQAMHQQSYRLAIQIGKLLLLIAFWPGRQWTFGMRNIIYNRIWHRQKYLLQGNVALTQERQQRWEQSSHPLREFYDSLEVVQTQVVYHAHRGKMAQDDVPVSIVKESENHGDFIEAMRELDAFNKYPYLGEILEERLTYKEKKGTVYSSVQPGGNRGSKARIGEGGL